MHKPRIGRLQTLYTAHPVYFITACTHRRARWQAAPGIHQALLTFSEQASARNVWVGRFVLMPDHLHLFVAFGDGAPKLSPWMKSLKNSLSKALRQNGIMAPHWEDGFFDHVLRSAESWEQKWIYVRDNPVRAGLVAVWQDWPYQGEVHHLTL